MAIPLNRLTPKVNLSRRILKAKTAKLFLYKPERALLINFYLGITQPKTIL